MIQVSIVHYFETAQGGKGESCTAILILRQICERFPQKYLYKQVAVCSTV